ILMQASSLSSSDSGEPGEGSESAEQGSLQQRGAAIERAVQRMSRLIQDLLDVARLEAGKLAIEAHALPARDIVLESVESQRELAAKASLELRADVEQAMPNIWADRDRTFQIFENLIGNAIRFT